MFTNTEDLLLQPGPVWHGTALGWRKSVTKSIVKLPIVSDRFCGVKYSVLDTSILAYTLYLPTAGQDEEFLEILSLLKHDITNNNTENCAVIIGTDSNVSNKSTKRRVNAMKVFLKEFSLETILINEEPTFHHNNMISESQIDHIFFNISESSNMKITLKDQLCLKDNSSNLSSHDVIVGEIILPKIQTKVFSKDFSSTYTDFIVKKPKWQNSANNEYQIQTERVLNGLFENFKEAEHIPALCEMFSKTLVISAQKNFETSNPKYLPKKRKNPNFSKEYQAAHANHSRVFKIWRKAGRPIDKTHKAKQDVLHSRRALQRLRRTEEARKSIELHDDLMNTFETDRNKIYEKLRKSRGDNYQLNDIQSIETLVGSFDGVNVLEGFRANTEVLCNDETNEDFNNDFLKMSTNDNIALMDITENEIMNIPHMNLPQLKEIIFKKLKMNKACDVFMLTVEHLRNAGDGTLLLLLSLLNNIIDNINVLSSPQLNTSIASVVFKGKGKPVFHHKSYRLVRVTPLIARIIDEYTRPELIEIVRPIQNKNQYGFTEKVSYILGAIQRHEVEKYCIDMKKTFFGCSLDGDSAFEVVNRDIQTRELYCAGERGKYWQATKYSYKNSLTRIKMNGKLSGKIEESLGVKQGRNKSSDHYKVYVAPLLDTIENSDLGVWVGPINVGVSGVADDIYLMSDKQTKLQEQLNIAVNYGKMFRVTYGASKTKITVVGSGVDVEYFQDVRPWTMDGKEVQVVEDNEHLGLVVSNINQAQKNVDMKVQKGRSNIYSLLGSGFAYKSHLSPVLKLHIYRTYTCPITRSGLSGLVLRPAQIETIALFQRKVLKSILKLTKTAPTPAIHFLTGELPVEGKLHRDIFSAFYSIWSQPDTKIHEIVKYLLENSCDSSRTWSIHVRHLSNRYGLEDPLICLRKDAPAKAAYKEAVKTKITAYFETQLRIAASQNSLMTYLNVAATGLSGRHHPALSNLITTHDVKMSRPHLKFLSGNYLTFSIKATQSGGSAHCRICLVPRETVSHIISSCLGMTDERGKLPLEYESLCLKTKTKINFNKISEDEELLCQFILDPSSLNLPERVCMNDPLLANFFKLSRDYCYLIDKIRTKFLSGML